METLTLRQVESSKVFDQSLGCRCLDMTQKCIVHTHPLPNSFNVLLPRGLPWSWSVFSCPWFWWFCDTGAQGKLLKGISFIIFSIQEKRIKQSLLSWEAQVSETVSIQQQLPIISLCRPLLLLAEGAIPCGFPTLMLNLLTSNLSLSLILSSNNMKVAGNYWKSLMCQVIYKYGWRNVILVHPEK